MKYVHVLCLLLSATFLTACSWPDSLRLPPVNDCQWADEIRFRPETKQWLLGLNWPQSAYADFNQIGDHNELWETYCN
jgi:hypothetical protein